MRKLLSVFLMIIIGTLLVFIWWRWFELRPQQLDLVEVVEQSVDITHPLDRLLIKYLKHIQYSPSLLAQFKRQEKSIVLADLAVDRCEVTQGDFRRFSTWRALEITPTKPHPKQSKSWVHKSQTQDHRILGQLNTPLGGVSFFDAWQYCHDGGGRLPTVAEFEAISGGSTQLYPWGNTFNNKPWQYQDPVLNIASHCNAYAQSGTANDIYDLANNVSEWATLDDKAVLMGGNAYNRPHRLHALNLIRRPAAFDFRSQYTGFRCVYPRANVGQTTAKLPWGTSSSITFIKGTTYTIGNAKSAKIPALLHYLTHQQIKSLNHFPLSDKKYSLKVMRYEVSRVLYWRFLRDPLVRLGFYNHTKQPENISHKPHNWQQQKTQLDKPITNITWWSAWSFANWLGGRLPSAKEWEALAGAGLTLFPYGNTYQASRTINYRGTNSQLDTIKASKDDSKNHIRGFSGNASEWTNTTVLKGNSFAIIIKGGSYLMPAESAKNYQIAQSSPAYTNPDLGFRVVFPIDK